MKMREIYLGEGDERRLNDIKLFLIVQTRIQIILEVNCQQHLKLLLFCLKTCSSAYWYDSLLYEPPAY